MFPDTASFKKAPKTIVTDMDLDERSENRASASSVKFATSRTIRIATVTIKLCASYKNVVKFQEVELKLPPITPRPKKISRHTTHLKNRILLSWNNNVDGRDQV